MSRYKIVIEYDGTGLLGWQKQLDGPSVQEYIETAIYNFSKKQISFDEKTKEFTFISGKYSTPSNDEINNNSQSPDKIIFVVYGSGRTDTGVHALGQVAHFDLETEMNEFKLREAINAHLKRLKANVCILEIEEVSDTFHARFEAKRRSYIYRVLNRRAPSPLNKNRVWHINHPLDIEKMREGAKYLIGRHDFTSFRATACQAKSPVRTLESIEIYQKGDEIEFYVEGISFLHHQVRNIVGTLKDVGDGTIAPEEIKNILEAKDRNAAGVTAPAHGLYFNKIWY